MTVTGTDVGLRLLVLAAVIMAARALPPQTNRRRIKKKRGTERKHSQFCVVLIHGAPFCASNLLILQALCRVQVVGAVSSFSAQPDSTIELC